MATNKVVSADAAEGGDSHRSRFELHLPTFVSSTKTSMDSARHCAEAALLHFEANGDTSLLQRFHDAMPKNYSRRAAFITWAADHSPLTAKMGKFVKNKKSDARPFNTTGALATPFWEYAPEAELVFYTAKDIVTEIEKLVNKFTNSRNRDNVTIATDAVTASAVVALQNFRTALNRDISMASSQTASN